MASTFRTCIAVFILFFHSRVVKSEEKTNIYQTTKGPSFPSFNDVPIDPSGSLLRDLLGLRSIPTLDYSFPSLLPLEISQQQNVQSNENPVKPTPSPAPPLPPPPYASIAKQQTTPVANYKPSQQNAIPYNPSINTQYSYPQYQQVPVSSDDSKGLPTRLEYKEQDGPSEYRRPVPRFVILARRPVASADDTKELASHHSAPQLSSQHSIPSPSPHHSISPSARPISAPRQNPSVRYLDTPRVALVPTYQPEEVLQRPSSQGQSFQPAQIEQIVKGPRYYLPQPTQGHQAFFGNFQQAPGSFDALLKADVSFLNHLNADSNKTEHNPQASTEDEGYNPKLIQENSQTTNDRYYEPKPDGYPPPPQISRPLPPPSLHAPNPIYRSVQSTAEKDQSYHNPIPNQEKKNHGNDEQYTYSPSDYEQRHPNDRVVYNVEPQPNSPKVSGYSVQHPLNYRASVEYQPNTYSNSEVVPKYRTEVQSNQQIPTSTSYRQAQQPNNHPFIEYRPQLQPNQPNLQVVPDDRAKPQQILHELPINSNRAEQQKQYPTEVNTHSSHRPNIRIVNIDPYQGHQQRLPETSATYRNVEHPQNYPPVTTIHHPPRYEVYQNEQKYIPEKEKNNFVRENEEEEDDEVPQNHRSKEESNPIQYNRYPNYEIKSTDELPRQTQKPISEQSYSNHQPHYRKNSHPNQKTFKRHRQYEEDEEPERNSHPSAVQRHRQYEEDEEPERNSHPPAVQRHRQYEEDEEPERNSHPSSTQRHRQHEEDEEPERSHPSSTQRHRQYEEDEEPERNSHPSSTQRHRQHEEDEEPERSHPSSTQRHRQYEEDEEPERNSHPSSTQRHRQREEDEESERDDHPSSTQRHRQYEEDEEPERDDHPSSTKRHRQYVEDVESKRDDRPSSIRRTKRQAASVIAKYQPSSNDPSVLKVFRAITVNGTDGVLVDERYVTDKDGNRVQIYTHTQPISDTQPTTQPTRQYELPIPDDSYATPSIAVTETTATDKSLQAEEALQPLIIHKNPQIADEPTCVKNETIPICTTDSEYPRKAINEALSKEKKFLSKLNGVSISSNKGTSNGQVHSLLDKSWSNICPSVVSRITPLRARNLKGEWKVIVNVDEVRQNLNIEICQTLGQKCNLVPLSYQTQCDQKYAVLHLLTYDNKEGLSVDQFLVPAACSCSVANKIK